MIGPERGGARPLVTRVDGASLAALFLAAVLVIPARLVVSQIPLTLPPALAVGLLMGLLLAGAHLAGGLGVAKGRNAVRTAIAVYIVTLLITYAVSTRRGLPVDELRVADSSMIRILGMVAVAWFVCDAVGTRLDTVLRALVAGVAFCAGIGLVQFAVGVDLAAYITLPGLRAETMYDAVESRSSLRRPTGTTNHPIEFGLVCAVTVPIATHYLLSAIDRRAPVGRWVLAIALAAGGALTSLSRTAIIGLVLAAIVIVIALPDPRKWVIGTVGAVGALGASAVTPGMLGTLYGMFAFLGTDSSVSGRTKDYPEALAQIDLHPWLGRGFGTWISSKYTILDNQYLLTLIENGWIGLASFAGLILTAAWAAVEVRRRSPDPVDRRLGACLLASLAVVAVGAATFDLLSFGVATGVMVVVIGATGALLRTVPAGARRGPAAAARATALRIAAARAAARKRAAHPGGTDRRARVTG